MILHSIDTTKIRFIGIDPSTKTGIVGLDYDGHVLFQDEIEESGPDPRRMMRIIQRVMQLLQPDDIVCVEGFGFASQTGFLLGGIGWGIRMSLFAKKIGYTEVAPAALKKFTGAGGNAAKEVLAVEVFKRWGFQSRSNNVTDAYVLAQIALALTDPGELTKFQKEVLHTIQHPPVKKKRAAK